MKSQNIDSRKIENRVSLNNGIKWLFLISTMFAVVVLGLLLYQIIRDSMGWLDLQFLTSNLSIFPEKAGIKGVIIGTVYMMLIVIPVTLILGVSTAIYLEEYTKDSKLQRIIKINISNLASVPSVIFGLLGLTVFSRVLGLGSSILSGGLDRKSVV